MKIIKHLLKAQRKVTENTKIVEYYESLLKQMCWEVADKKYKGHKILRENYEYIFLGAGGYVWARNQGEEVNLKLFFIFSRKFHPDEIPLTRPDARILILTKPQRIAVKLAKDTYHKKGYLGWSNHRPELWFSMRWTLGLDQALSGDYELNLK